MTVTIQTGPAWISIDNQGRLTGVPPLPGTYTVVLSSTVGVFSASLTVTIEATALGEVLINSISKLLTMGGLVLAFQAEVGIQEPNMFGAVFNFSAEADLITYLGNLTMSFTAEAIAPPPGFTLPLPPNTQELISGTGLVDSYNTNSNNRFSYRIIKPNPDTFTVGVTDIVPSPGATANIYISLREDNYSGVNLSAYQNLYIGSTANWSLTVPGLPAGIYYLDFSIGRNRPSALDSFTVTGTWDIVLTDANEPNFGPKAAKSVTLGTTLSNKLTVDDEDWFAFSTTGTDPKGVSLTFSQMVQPGGATPGFRVDLYTVSPSGDITGYIGSTGAMDISTLATTARRSPPTTPGNYMVRVKYLTGVYTNYDLNVSQFSVPADSYEDDGELALATTLANGVPSTGHTLQAGDVDWFKVVLSNPSVLTIALTNVVISSYLLYPGVSLSVVLPNGDVVEDFYQAFIGTASSPGSGATSDTTVTRSTTDTLAAGVYYIIASQQVDGYDLTASWV